MDILELCQYLKPDTIAQIIADLDTDEWSQTIGTAIADIYECGMDLVGSAELERLIAEAQRR